MRGFGNIKEKNNKEIIEKAVETILTDGLELEIQDNPHLQKTPQRVAKAILELTTGYKQDIQEYKTVFPNNDQEDNQIIILHPIQAYSLCSHHLLPFKMEISIGYIPRNEIIGISKLERITQNICRKLQVQENIATEIIQDINTLLNPHGVIVYINNTEHTCMTMRGVKSAKAGLTTLKTSGLFKDEKYSKQFMQMIQ